MKFIKEADKLYLKLEEEEDGFYKKRKVYPVLNKDGSVNWFNLYTGGTWFKLITTIIIITIIIGFIIEYHNNTEFCRQLVSQYNNSTLESIKPFIKAP